MVPAEKRLFTKKYRQFQPVLDSVNQKTRLVGVLISLEGQVELKLEKLNIVYVIGSILNTLLSSVDLSYATYQEKDDLFKTIVHVMFIVMSITSRVFSFFLINYRPLIKKVFTFCAESHNPLPVLKPIADPIFEKAQQDAIRLISRSVDALYFTFVSLTLLTSVIAVWQGDYYRLPINMPIIWLPPENPLSFFINYIHQCWVVITVLSFYMTFSLILIVFGVYALAHLEMIRRMADKLKDTAYLEELLPLTVEKLAITKQFLSEMSKVLSPYMYLLEKLLYAVILNCWLIWQIDKEKISTSLATLFCPASLLLFVLFCEKASNKIRKINVALYDIPWYELKPKQRRLLLPLLQSTQYPILFKAGGISNISLEWFAGITKGAYSMGVILANMLEA